VDVSKSSVIWIWVFVAEENLGKEGLRLIVIVGFSAVSWTIPIRDMPSKKTRSLGRTLLMVGVVILKRVVW